MVVLVDVLIYCSALSTEILNRQLCILLLAATVYCCLQFCTVQLLYQPISLLMYNVANITLFIQVLNVIVGSLLEMLIVDTCGIQCFSYLGFMHIEVDFGTVFDQDKQLLNFSLMVLINQTCHCKIDSSMCNV